MHEAKTGEIQSYFLMWNINSEAATAGPTAGSRLLLTLRLSIIPARMFANVNQPHIHRCKD